MYGDTGTMMEAYSNNTFDFNALEQTIIELKQNSFLELYGIQLALTSVQRFDFKMADLVMKNVIDKISSVYPRKYVVYIDKNFIVAQNRLKFKKSQFYNKELSLFDIAGNPELFANALSKASIER
jgi:hypothetical protein